MYKYDLKQVCKTFNVEVSEDYRQIINTSLDNLKNAIEKNRLVFFHKGSSAGGTKHKFKLMYIDDDYTLCRVYTALLAIGFKVKKDDTITISDGVFSGMGRIFDKICNYFDIDSKKHRYNYEM